MAWVALDQSKLDGEKTLYLAELLGIKPVYALGHVAAVLLWALDNTADGTLSERVTPRSLSRVAEWDGDPEHFSDALIQSGYLHIQNGHYVIQEWYAIAGKFTERRERNAERMRHNRRPNPVDLPVIHPNPSTDVHSTCNAHNEHMQDTLGACVPPTITKTEQNKTKNKNKDETHVTQEVIDTLAGPSEAAATMETSSSSSGEGNGWVDPAIQEGLGHLPILARQLGFRVNPALRRELTACLMRYEPEWVDHALREAAFRGTKNPSYVRSILDNWLNEGGIRTSHDAGASGGRRSPGSSTAAADKPDPRYAKFYELFPPEGGALS